MNGETFIKEIFSLPYPYSLGVAHHYFDYIAKVRPPRLDRNSVEIRVCICRRLHAPNTRYRGQLKSKRRRITEMEFGFWNLALGGIVRRFRFG
jgi:hypothetical protein